MYSCVNSTLNQIAFNRFGKETWADLSPDEQASLKSEVVALREDARGFKYFTSEATSWRKWTVEGADAASTSINRNIGRDQDQFVELQQATGIGQRIVRRTVDDHCTVGQLVQLGKEDGDWNAENNALVEFHKLCDELIVWASKRQPKDDPERKTNIEQEIERRLERIVLVSTDGCGSPFRVLEYLSARREKSMERVSEDSTSRHSSQYLQDRLEAMKKLECVDARRWTSDSFRGLLNATDSIVIICQNNATGLEELRTRKQHLAAGKDGTDLKNERVKLITEENNFYKETGFDQACKKVMSSLLALGIPCQQVGSFLEHCIPDMDVEYKTQTEKLMKLRANAEIQAEVEISRMLPTPIDNALDSIAVSLAPGVSIWEQLPESVQGKHANWCITFNSPVLKTSSKAPDGWSISNWSFLLTVDGAENGAYQLAKDTNRSLKEIKDFCTAIGYGEELELMNESAKIVSVKQAVDKRKEINEWATDNRGVIKLKKLADEFREQWLRKSYQATGKETEDLESRTEIETGIKNILRDIIKLAVDHLEDPVAVVRYLQAIVERSGAATDPYSTKHYACAYAQKRVLCLAPIVEKLVKSSSYQAIKWLICCNVLKESWLVPLLE